MFGLSKENKEPLGDAKSAERWFGSLPGNDPLALEREVLDELGKLCEQNARRTPQGLEAVFRVEVGSNGLPATL